MSWREKLRQHLNPGKVIGLDGSGQPIYDHMGTNAPDFAGMLRRYNERARALAGNPTPPMSASVGQPPPAAAPPAAAPPPVSAAPPIPAAAPTGGAPVTTPPPRAAAMARINQSMMGPPEPEQGPPAPPSSEPLGSIFDDMDPLVIEQILQLGDKDRQLAHAEAMRDQENPNGRYVSNGRIYVAGSPLEHGVAAFGKFRGKRQADRIGQEQIEGRRRILDILKKQ